MIRRPRLVESVRQALARSRIVALLGPRQCGKTTLAGRIAYLSMSGFSLEEVGLAAHVLHWLRGGFPLSYLAEDDGRSALWRADFIRTLLERDLGQAGLSPPSTTLLRFWTMAAHYHGQIWNNAEIAGSMGIGQRSVRRYLDVLTDLYMIRQLQPWHANLKKRQVRSPKVFFRDTGLLHSLLGLRTE